MENRPTIELRQYRLFAPSRTNSGSSWLRHHVEPVCYQESKDLKAQSPDTMTALYLETTENISCNRNKDYFTRFIKIKHKINALKYPYSARTSLN